MRVVSAIESTYIDRLDVTHLERLLGVNTLARQPDVKGSTHADELPDQERRALVGHHPDIDERQEGAARQRGQRDHDAVAVIRERSHEPPSHSSSRSADARRRRSTPWTRAPARNAPSSRSMAIQGSVVGGAVVGGTVVVGSVGAGCSLLFWAASGR